MPTFLTTTCLMFSTSEKNQNVQNKTSSFFKHTAFKHLYILDSGIFACIPVTTLRTSRKNAKCVVLASDFIQRLRIKCRCLTKQSFNIKENIVLPICLMVSMRIVHCTSLAIKVSDLWKQLKTFASKSVITFLNL